MGSRVRQVALAVLLLAGYLSALGHTSFARHAICLEHGELVDLQPTAQVAAPDLDSRDNPGLHNPGEATVSLGDEHCALSQLSRQLVSGARPVVPLASLALEPTPSTRSAVLASRGLILRLAPKQSPPV